MQLKIRRLTKKCGKKVALKNFSYTFEPEIYGLLSINDLGKRTILKTLTSRILLT